jgi:acyloxyacyl hydrolase
MAPTLMLYLVRAAALAALLPLASEAQSVTCVACVAIFGLLEQLGNAAAPPEATCKNLTVCDGSCVLFKSWPAASPNFPSDGGPADQRRALQPLPGAALPTRAEAAAFVSLVADAEAAAARRAGRQPTVDEVVALFLRGVASRAADAEIAAGDGALAIAASPACDGGFNLTCEISRVFDDHLPLVDGDNDTFAGPADAASSPFLSNHFRGASWRGRDCNDTRADVYPGRLDLGLGPAALDSNCNGIFGTDPLSQRPYEELFCSGANAPMGIAILGDSAAAHFHLPPQYVNAQNWNLSGLLELAGNEADWPQCSWATGFRDAAACPRTGFIPPNNGSFPFPPTASLYQRFAAMNLCNHRDLQNIGVNGARTDSMAPGSDGGFGIVDALARSAATDAPLLVIYALIGNDVCNGHPGADSMTTVPEFKANVLASLAVLNSTLPRGSHVAFLGLADGRVLYNTTHTHTHPIGVPYPDLYEALSCNGCNPCWGWLNTNSTWRDFTSERAANLTAVYDVIISESAAAPYTFDLYRINLDWVALIEEYVALGGNAFDVIEPGDGFHPSQTGNALFSAVIWQDLLLNRPTWLPSLNPFNSNITALFGDQGGF